MKSLIAGSVVILFFNPSGVSAVGSDKAVYAGGTIARFNATGKSIAGQLDLSSAHRLVFIPEDRRHAAQPLSIEYKSIRDLEFGQKVGRRAAVVAGATVLWGPAGLLSLLSKSREHFLTVAYADDDGHIQVSIFEVGKSAVRTTLAVVEARSGVPIEYQNDDARKWRR